MSDSLKLAEQQLLAPGGLDQQDLFKVLKEETKLKGFFAVTVSIY